MKIYAAKNAPAPVRGLVRDLRPLWALEEIGAAYEIEWIDAGAGEQRGDHYKAIHPFGKIPAAIDGDVTMFESGAICIYAAEKYQALGAGTALWPLVLTWSFCALDQIYPSLFERFVWGHFRKDQEGSANIVAAMTERANANFAVLESELGKREFMAGPEFTAADVLMGSALLNARTDDLMAPYPALSAYAAGLYERPAFKKVHAMNGVGPA